MRARVRVCVFSLSRSFVVTVQSACARVDLRVNKRFRGEIFGLTAHICGRLNANGTKKFTEIQIDEH